MNAALGYPQKQAQQQELVISAGQATADGEDSPCNQKNADEFLGAPMFRQMATGYLQREITPEENSGNGSCLLRIQMQISADSRQGKRDVSAIDKRDRVHDESDGNDANPSLRRRVAAHRRCCIGLLCSLGHVLCLRAEIRWPNVIGA